MTTVRYQGNALTDTFKGFNAKKQGTVLSITGSYKYRYLIQQLVQSLEIRVKNIQTIKTKENCEHINT